MRLASWLSAILCLRGESLEHDPEKWEPVSDKIMLKGSMIPKSGNRFSDKIMLNG